MWSPRPSEPPPAGWWHELETAEQYETRRWVEGIADGLRAERIERLRARIHEVDMKAAGALARDRWERINRRRDGWGAQAGPPPGHGIEARWAGEVENGRPGGSILSVR
jgi:hypothetical protein